MEASSFGICRTCLLESKQMLSLYKNAVISERIAELSVFLKELTNLECVQDDGQPVFVCRDCVQQLSNAISFKDMCLRSATALRANNATDAADNGDIPPEEARDIQKKKEDVPGTAEEWIVEVDKITKTDDATVEVMLNDAPKRRSRKQNLSQISIEVPEWSQVDVVENQDAVKKGKIRKGIKVKDEKDPSSHQCNVCGKVLTQAGSLKVHLATHLKDARYECGLCDKQFKTKGRIQHHMKIHMSKKSHKCSICGKCYTYSASLRTHFRGHTKPFVCSVCGRKFNQAAGLQRHLKSHPKDKPFQCEFCNKSFRINSQLDIHRKSHKTEKRPEGIRRNVTRNSTQKEKSNSM